MGRANQLEIPHHVITAIQSGDAAAFKFLVTTLYAPLVRFARGVLRAQENRYKEAEDIVQDVFAGVWERRASWNPRGNAVTYLFGTVRHRAIDVVRAQASEARRYDILQRIDGSDGGSVQTPEDEILAAEANRDMGKHYLALQRIVAGLSERQRSAYVLRYRQGLTVPEVAEILGISTKSGEQLLSRVLKTIREQMRAL